MENSHFSDCSDETSLKKTNQLGGSYVNGKPLPKEIRVRVLQLAQMGVRPCEISRKLKITHGCISKLLAKFHETGSIDPGNKNVGRPKVITPEIEMKIDQYRNEQPGIFSWELKERLIRDRVCTHDNVPSLSSISRLIKSKIVSEANKKRTQTEELEIKIKEQHILESSSRAASFSKWSTYRDMSCNNCSSSSSPSSDSPPSENIDSSSTSSTDSDLVAKRISFSISNILGHDENSGNQPTTSQYSSEGASNVEVAREEFFDPMTPFEEHYAALSQYEKSRRHRIKFTPDQIEELEREFEKDAYPGTWKRTELAMKLEVEEGRIQVWFSNRRAKGKRRGSSMSLPLLNEPSESFEESGNEHEMCTCRPCSAPVIMQGLPYSMGPSRIFFPPGYKS